MLLNLIMAAATGDVASGGGEMSDIQVESLVRDLAFILLMGAVVTVLFKWLKQPVVLGYIVAGFLASPHFHYLPSVTTESNINSGRSSALWCCSSLWGWNSASRNCSTPGARLW